MKLSLMVIFSLYGYGTAGKTFEFFQGKSLQQTSQQYEVTSQPVSSMSHRHCAMFCHLAPQCLAADYEGDLNLCRLYSDTNGTTVGKESDFSVVKNDFGISVGPYGEQGGITFSDREYFTQYGYITAIRSWRHPTHYNLGIQFRYGSVWAPKRGHALNTTPNSEVFLDSGTFIDEINLWSGTILDSVTLYSENGDSLGHHGHSLKNRTQIRENKLMYIEGEITTWHSHPSLSNVYFHFHG